MLNVALTGNVGSGKSTVARYWADAGIPVVSADELSRQAVAPGSPGLAEVVEAFGEEVLAADGTLDRDRLRAIIFADEAGRRRLEQILHPRIRELRAEWLEEQRRDSRSVVVSEIPLLFETGAEGEFDVTVLVDAPAGVRRERIVRDRGLSAEEADRIMSAQMDPDRKRRAADIVVDNTGTLDDLRVESERVLADLFARAGRPANMKVDLHLHTLGSWDCLSDPEAVLDRALHLGYGRIAITDHDSLGVALAMHAKHPEHVIPGEEVKTAEGIDVIGLYLAEEIPRGTPAREAIERIRSQGGISYLPHPYAGGKGGGGRLADELAPLCDVVEGFNARLHSASLNERAQELATRHGKRVGAGSDAHTVAEIGNAFIELPVHPNRPEALLSALGGPCRWGGSTASRLVHLASTWAKVRKRLPGA